MVRVGSHRTRRGDGVRFVRSLVAGLLLAACSLAASADWAVDAAQSEITYLSSKMTGGFATIFENNRFRNFSGGISAAGEVTLDIDMRSVDTGILIRDERVVKYAFAADQHPLATVRLSLGEGLKEHYAPGAVRAVEATLTMRGISRQVKGQVSVTRAGGTLLVQTTAPILINAADYGMLDGFETLKDLVKLFNIPTTVPVSLKLVFTDR